MTQDRRSFIKLSVGATGGLLASLSLPNMARGALPEIVEPGAKPGATGLGAWIRIDRQGKVTFLMSQSEMGQGAHTGLAMVVAEELDAPFEHVTYEQAPVSPDFFNPRYVGANGGQGTGGSSSISQVAPPLRQACAAVRAVLLEAGARAMRVEPDQCRTELGFVIHAGSGRRLGYGAVSEEAALLPLPAKAPVKHPRDFRLLGTRVARRDSPAKMTGAAGYGIDVALPGMLTAVVARCPVFGGQVESFDSRRAAASPGVKAVVRIGAGVAVVADSFWHAKRGRDLLQVQWRSSPDDRWDSANLESTFQALLQTTPIVARNDGDAEAALVKSAKKIESIYHAPYLDTAPMEPMNATAFVEPGRCRIWAPMQFQSRALSAAMRITGLPAEKIAIHTTYMGGGFGRRFYHDFIEEALEVSKAVGKPVKVVRTREDDMTHSFYRPASYNRMSAGLDTQGRIMAWKHTAVSSSILKTLWPERVNAKTGLDGTASQGASNLLYDLPHYRMDWVRADSPVPVGIWRSVGDSQNAFVTQCFIDELALAAGTDPVEFRRAHLTKTPQAQRLRAVLDLVADKAGWGKPLAPGRFHGVAAVQCYGAYAAQVAEVSVGPDGKIKVHKVVAGLDCGWVTSPDLVRQQAEGGIAYGLSAAMSEEITVKGGAVEQTNFHQYSMLRLADMPEVEFHIMPSHEPALSVGEPAGTPCIAPAVANAVFAATGVRMRSMPFSKHKLRSA